MRSAFPNSQGPEVRWWILLPVLWACAPPEAPPAVFIALSRDFEGYGDWPSVTLDGGTIDVVHMAGLRRVFLNARPDAGATEWPVGTIIVKELPFTTFAMVKRGDGYNERGARGWEWFELVPDIPNTVLIKWRGLGPPLGENYSKTGATCNDCHGAHVVNDSVLTPGLQLLSH